MRKLAPVLLLLLLVWSCDRGNTDGAPEVVQFPSEEAYKEAIGLSHIYLDSIEDYRELVESIDSIACMNKTPVVNFCDEEAGYMVIPFYHCSQIKNTGFVRQRDRLYIQADTVFANRRIKVPIDSLEFLLEKHLLNNGRNPYFSGSPKNAGIEIYLDSPTPAWEVEEFLLDLVASFNSISEKTSDSLFFKVEFGKMPLGAVPPLPPAKL